MSRAFSLAMRTLAREWRSGELGVLLLALVIAVAALTGVGFLTGRVGAAVDLQAAEVLAADLRFLVREAAPPGVVETVDGCGPACGRLGLAHSLGALDRKRWERPEYFIELLIEYPARVGHLGLSFHFAAFYPSISQQYTPPFRSISRRREHSDRQRCARCRRRPQLSS